MCIIFQNTALVLDHVEIGDEGCTYLSTRKFDSVAWI